MLTEYKRAICHHSSHLGPKREQGGLLSIFVSLLAEPLSKTGTERTDEDHLTIELVLHLFRNLLAAEPLLKTSAEASDRSKQLHDELLTLYDREYVLEILLVLGANMEQRENLPYNLLVMELLHHLLRQQDPTAVARSSSQSLSKNSHNASTNASTTRGVGGQENPKLTSTTKATGLLKGHLDREKQTLGSASALTSRHSHFGGTMVVNRPGGKRQYVSAASLDPRHKIVAAAGAPAKRKNKRFEPFIGSGRTLQSHTRLIENNGGGPAAIRAQRTLDNFCRRFVKECYGPVMKSLKNEFRRDSVRLEEGDRVVFFRIAWFFCQWWRVSPKAKTVPAVAGGDQKNDASSSENVLGQLIFTMDVFTFNLVLNATDTFQEQKKPVRLAQCVALLSEMLHLLHVMYTSNDSTEQIMAMGLMDRLYYGSEALDRLPKLLSKWKEGTSTREYLCDLTEVCHMTLKLLETHAKSCIAASAGAAKAKIAEHDTVAKMKAAAADFDVSGYFARKIVSNHTVYMYTQLLSQYFVNAPHVNHRIIAFFLRAGKLEVVSPEPIDPEMPQNLLATKKVTLEPMLYTVHLISVLNTILNDSSIRKEKDYTATLSFAVRIVQNFATAAQDNPVLFVEALFKHPHPHRFCELATNSYVSEELRMIAERELLMEEHARFEKEVAATRDEDDDEDEEEELEFEDFGTSSVGNTNTKRVPAKPARRIFDDSDDEEDSKPAAKRKSGELEDSDDEEDAVMEELQAKKAAARSAEMHKRMRKLDKDGGDSSSDDEELYFGMGQTTTKASNSKAARTFLDDEDDDDDDNNEGVVQ